MNRKQIYPNLNRENKWLGIIDYKLLALFMLYIFIIWNVSGAIIPNALMRIYILIIAAIPIIGLFYSNKSSTNICDAVYAIIKYIVLPKLYVYKFESKIDWVK